MARKFQNLETQRLYDRTRGDGEKKSAKSEADDGGGEKESDGEETPIEQVVDEHGPAHTTTIKKEGDGYSVHSHHEDGHKHKSKGHESAHAAHAHSMQAMGEEPEGGSGEHEEPDGDEGAPVGMSSIPGM